MTQLKCREIGTSQGFVIPNKILFALGISKNDVVEAHVVKNKLIIEKSTNPRSGWSQAFAKMAQHDDDILIFSDILDGEDIDAAI